MDYNFEYITVRIDIYAATDTKGTRVRVSDNYGRKSPITACDYEHGDAIKQVGALLEAMGYGKSSLISYYKHSRCSGPSETIYATYKVYNSVNASPRRFTAEASKLQGAGQLSP